MIFHYRYLFFALVATATYAQLASQNASSTILRVDNGTYGSAVEEYHYYYDQFPIGLAVSSTGRIFVCYTRGTYNYTLGEVTSTTQETPYPDIGTQISPNSLSNITSGIPLATNNSTGLISVQALVITPATSSRPETLWILDTGRPTVTIDGVSTMLYGVPGGPKLLGLNIANNSIYETFTFPESVHYVDSYMNDLRFDLRPNVTDSGRGIVYMVDSSSEGRNGFIMLDLGTGESWRRLNNHPSTLSVPNVVASYQGLPFYQRVPGLTYFNHLAEGIDGVQIDPSGENIYYSPLTSDYLYSIETKYLRDHTSATAEQAASNNVKSLGQRGGNANGFEGDSNGLIYQAMPESNAIFTYNPTTLLNEGFVRDPRIIWPDSMSIAEDGYLYVNINQLPYMPGFNNGTDLRETPGAILRAKLPGNGTKINSLG